MSVIAQLSTFADLPSFVRKGDLVLFDIDETLVRPEPDATEPWFVAFCSALQDAGAPHKAAVFSAGVEIWQGLQGVCDCAPPEGETTTAALAAVAAITGVTCVGLTARGPECHEETVAQLIRCGAYHGVFDAESSLGTLAPATAADAAAYVAPLTHRGGIIYCSGSRKPQGFFAFEACGGGVAVSSGVPDAAAAAAASASSAASQALPPRRVVLIDDRESHVKALHAACAERGRPFLGLHYASESEVVTSAVTLARGWSLLARVLARESGRARIRRMCDIIEAEDGSKRWHTSALMCGAIGVGVGVTVSALAVLAARGRRT